MKQFIYIYYSGPSAALFAAPSHSLPPLPLDICNLCAARERRQQQKPSDKLACQQLVQTAESCKQQQR